MTRETKVGLLVGICVILLIAIVISDQLAVMQQDPARLTDFAAQAQNTFMPPANQPAAAEQRHTSPQPLPLPQELAQPTRNTAQHSNPLEQRPGSRALMLTRLAEDFQAVQTQQSASQQPQIATAADNEPIYHHVASGQTLSQIARYYYGEPGKWRVIQNANADKVNAQGHIHPGQRLVIPRMGASAAPTAPERPSTYTVRPGDSLSSIAAHTLGSSSQYHRLFEANRDQLRDPNSIRVGMELRIPQ